MHRGDLGNTTPLGLVTGRFLLSFHILLKIFKLLCNVRNIIVLSQIHPNHIAKSKTKQELQHGARPFCLPACLPGKSGGRQRLLFRVPARPHRRGDGCAHQRPWAAAQSRSSSWASPAGQRLGERFHQPPAALGDKDGAKRATGHLLNAFVNTGRCLVAAIQPATADMRIRVNTERTKSRWRL